MHSRQQGSENIPAATSHVCTRGAHMDASGRPGLTSRMEAALQDVWHRLRVVSYNCQSLTLQRSTQDICSYLGASLIGLQGTQLDKRQASFLGRDSSVIWKCGNHDVILWPYGQGGHTNKSAGVAVVLSRHLCPRSCILVFLFFVWLIVLVLELNSHL